MSPTLAVRRLAQEILKSRVDPALEVDGAFGRESAKSAAKWIPWTFKGKPTAARWVAAVIQKEAALRGINAGTPDAWYGPQTADAADRIILQIQGKPLPVRPDEIPDATGKPGGSTIRCWSPTTAQLRARYGQEGTGQDMVDSPYGLLLDWDLSTQVFRFSAHASLKPRIEAAMGEVLVHYGLSAIRNLGLNRFGGCLNVRLKRGGSTPSTHSWGSAIDWFPTNNQLKQTHRSAAFAKPAYAAFLAIWEKHGFMSLGRCFDFDWMHLQANP
jgi:hypothetical protein